MSEVMPVTAERAREALEDMDDYARMDAGVDARGPREVLERFIAEHERAVEALRAEVDVLKAENEALLDALRQITEWPDGGNRYGQENIKRFALAAIARHAQGELQ